MTSPLDAATLGLEKGLAFPRVPEWGAADKNAIAKASTCGAHFEGCDDARRVDIRIVLGMLNRTGLRTAPWKGYEVEEPVARWSIAEGHGGDRHGGFETWDQARIVHSPVGEAAHAANSHV